MLVLKVRLGQKVGCGPWLGVRLETNEESRILFKFLTVCDALQQASKWPCGLRWGQVPSVGCEEPRHTEPRGTELLSLHLCDIPLTARFLWRSSVIELTLVFRQGLFIYPKLTPNSQSSCWCTDRNGSVHLLLTFEVSAVGKTGTVVRVEVETTRRQHQSERGTCLLQSSDKKGE